MPATNEQFIKAAFEAGLTEDEVRQAVSERNASLASRQPTTQTTPNDGKLKFQQGDNPLLYAAAKAQEATAPAAKMFGETDVLPVAGAIAGRALLPNAAGTGLGAAGGKALQGLFKPGDTSLPEILKTGGEAAAWDLALTKIIPTIFMPGKAAMKASMKARGFFITKNGEKVINGTKAAEAVTKTYNKIPAAQRTPAVKKAYEATIRELKGRLIPLGKAVEEKMSYFKPVFSETTGQKLKGTPLNQILESAGHGLRSQIREASPGVAAADDVFAALQRAKQAMKWPTRIATGGAIAGGVGYGVSKALGSVFGR